MQGNGAGSGHMDVGMTKVSSLQLGNAVVKDQIFAVMGIDAMGKIEGVGMPGMVGFETFRRFVTRVDYGHGTLTLIRPDAFDPKDAGTPVPFKFYGNTIAAPGSYNGVKGDFTIDTGSRSSIQLDGPFVAQNHLNGDNQTAGTVTGWGIGGPSRSIVARSGVFELGSVPVHGAVVEFSTDKGGAMADASLAGNVGAGVLKRFVVTLDYEHQVMYLKPIAGGIPDLDTWDRAGMWFNQNDEGYTVVDVTKGAPADQAGFKAGDEITAINGKPATGLKLYEVRQMLRDEAPGTVVTFAVKRGSDTKDIPVTLRDLI
jgi:membrane-associated protease RseP (regulator of RpoE activity)